MIVSLKQLSPGHEQPNSACADAGIRVASQVCGGKAERQKERRRERLERCTCTSGSLAASPIEAMPGVRDAHRGCKDFFSSYTRRQAAGYFIGSPHPTAIALVATVARQPETRAWLEPLASLP